MRTFTFADIAAYKSAKASGGSIYAALIGDANLKSGAVVSKITATGDVLIDAMNPFVTPNLATNDDILYYSSTEGYRSLRKGKTTWDANSLGQIYIDTSRLPSGFAVVAEYNDIFSFKSMQGETTGSGRSKMTSIRGNSVAWNQFLIPSPRGANGIEVTFDSTTKLFHFSGTATANANGGLACWTNNVVPSGHKVVLRIRKAGGTYNSSTGFFSDQYASGTYPRIPLSGGDAILTVGQGGYSIPQILSLNAGDTFDAYYSITEYDLTLLYGSAIDGMTDAQILAKFEAEFGNGNFDPDAGRILSNKAKAIEFVGFNQWDEEWEVGTIGPDGKNMNMAGRWRSKNFIPVLPSTTYYHIGAVSLAMYDADKNFLYNTDYGTFPSDTTFETLSNARYIRFVMQVQPHDICINLSDSSKNGTYEPYKKTIVPLDVTKIRVKSPNIWDEEWELGVYSTSSGQKEPNLYCIRSKNYISVLPSETYYFKAASGVMVVVLYYDANKNFLIHSYEENETFTTPANCRYITFNTIAAAQITTYNHDICINKSDPGFNGKYYPHGSIVPFPEGAGSAGSVYDEIRENKITRRKIRVNLGNLNWTYGDFGGVNAFYAILYHKASSNAICSKYTVADTQYVDTMPDKTIMVKANSSYVYVRDDSYTDSISFKAAMQNQNVQFDYESENPEVFELDYPLTPIIYPAKGGTKRILPVNGSSPVTAPFSCMVQPI